MESKIGAQSIYVNILEKTDKKNTPKKLQPKILNADLKASFIEYCMSVP